MANPKVKKDRDKNPDAAEVAKLRAALVKRGCKPADLAKALKPDAENEPRENLRERLLVYVRSLA